MCENKWRILNRIISVWEKYFKLFSVCKLNQHLIVCKQISTNIFENKITYKLLS